MSILREFCLGPLTARYLKEARTGSVGLVLFPTAEADRLVARRKFLSGLEIDAFAATLPSPLAADAILGLAQAASPADGALDGFASGRTLLGSPTCQRLRLTRLSSRRKAGVTRITAKFRHPNGWTFQHELEHEAEAAWVRTTTRVFNAGKEPLTLDLLASGTMTGITPFADDAAPGFLHLHRFRSVWSMEGRLESQPVEELQLEPSWSGHGVRCERFGVSGSMPVNGWFPRVILEDTRSQVSWGLEIEHHASWQIEIYRRGDSIGLAGGLADYEQGHWRKVLAPGESVESPGAVFACVNGSVDECCDALNAAHTRAAADVPAIEHDLPVLFNEWGTNWGFPSHAKTVDLADRLRGLGIKYLVIDAGWFAKTPGDWEGGHGDWIPNKDLFPEGLKATADAIRKAGMIPGLWFEMETCGHRSDVFQKQEMLVCRDGRPVTTCSRRHLDLRANLRSAGSWRSV